MLVLWDLASGKPIGQPWQWHDQGTVARVAFSPDGKRVLSGGENGMLVLWDVVSGNPIGQPWPGHRGMIKDIVFSPDGKRVVSRGEHGMLLLWDIASGNSISQPWSDFENSFPITGLGFSQDGKQVIIHDIRGGDTVLDIDPESLVNRACGKVNRNFTREEWNHFIGEDTLTYRKTCEQFSLEE